jgi:toxin FitB
MNVVDSSGWLEYFADGENASFFAAAIEDTDKLVIPVVCIYEVFKRVLLTRGIDAAEQRIADLFKGQTADLTASVALSAAKLSAELKLPMADSLILATAYAYNAALWTQDEHFKGLPGVHFIEKKKG